jgi:FdhE protein
MTLANSAQRQIDALRAAQPETVPWLALLAVALQEVANPVWDAVAAGTTLQPERVPATPLLAGATVPVPVAAVERWVHRVLTLAGEAGAEAASLRPVADVVDPLAFLAAALNADGERIDAIALAAGVDALALHAAASLVAMPLLQALRRRFGPGIDPYWSEGICPICGAWPLLAEQRGLERARRLRCGRCGGDWAQPGIRCPYCDVTGHQARAALVSEEHGEARKVETCVACRGYLKSISTLRAWPGDEVVLADLATIELDLVALERDFTRPEPRRLEPGMRIEASGDQSDEGKM